MGVARRMMHSTLPYVLVDKTVVANDWNDLVDGMLAHAINLDEHGIAVPVTLAPVGFNVWTNTTTNGSQVGFNDCSNWTSADSMSYGSGGTLSSTDGSWTQASGTEPCSNFNRIYCVEQ